MGDADTDAEETVRCWLVERTYTDRDLIDLVYATPDGSRVRRKQISATIMRQRGAEATAATDVSTANLDPVADDQTRERYRAEVERVRAEYDPDDEL
ncbi:hypothetical protein C499_11601 [Halogeometricum borinquense DSM 11551]|uniref:DUF7967 domain-containing protein n=1 Tax=Halogeometricum borinquense (strain ATCC 700274 / DSM 11551 / JCM 10706 / KCTC 4070 / PR3) TaxID=469382 RepID=E4NSV9_HALBP|nr:hypothetical protein [Halogeometricum borinquense]ADQ65847.1 hypothetical protein Hbor_02370 [Halogeometricum borinquense DSM 11551]ELY26849.1 hypothetical protein C499_11601 [Halogeometricum borinquense DSM 11551]